MAKAKKKPKKKPGKKPAAKKSPKKKAVKKKSATKKAAKKKGTGKKAKKKKAKKKKAAKKGKLIQSEKRPTAAFLKKEFPGHSFSEIEMWVRKPDSAKSMMVAGGRLCGQQGICIMAAEHD